MTDFRVTWEADVFDADRPVQAARMARAMQTRPGTIATVFDVFEEGKEPVRVDLTKIDEGEVDEVSAALGFMTTGKAEEAEEEVIDAGTGSDLATVLAALRLFQKTYQDCGSESIREDYPEHFTDNDGKPISPLGSEDIDALCERLNFGRPAQPTGRMEVWILTTDGDGSGYVYTSQKAAYQGVIEWVLGDEDGWDEEEKALNQELQGYFAAGDYAAIRATAKGKTGDSVDQFFLLDSQVIDIPAPAPLEPAIVTIVGGCADVAENPSSLPVEVLDYDNLQAIIEECRPKEDGEPWKRDLNLDAASLAFIRKYDEADFIAEVEAALAEPEAEAGE